MIHDKIMQTAEITSDGIFSKIKIPIPLAVYNDRYEAKTLPVKKPKITGEIVINGIPTQQKPMQKFIVSSIKSIRILLIKADAIPLLFCQAS